MSDTTIIGGTYSRWPAQFAALLLREATAGEAVPGSTSAGHNQHVVQLREMATWLRGVRADDALYALGRELWLLRGATGASDGEYTPARDVMRLLAGLNSGLDKESVLQEWIALELRAAGKQFAHLTNGQRRAGQVADEAEAKRAAAEEKAARLSSSLVDAEAALTATRDQLSSAEAQIGYLSRQLEHSTGAQPNEQPEQEDAPDPADRVPVEVLEELVTTGKPQHVPGVPNLWVKMTGGVPTYFGRDRSPRAAQEWVKFVPEASTTVTRASAWLADQQTAKATA